MHHWYRMSGEGGAVPDSPVGWDASVDTLLGLDAPGWARFLQQSGADQQLIRRLDRLVANWLDEDDYRQLRKMAVPRVAHASDTEVPVLFSDWISAGDAKRLGFLVAGMGFLEPNVPVCYAMCSAVRAVEAALDYVRLDHGFSDEEQATMEAEMRRSDSPYRFVMPESEGDSSL